MVDDNQDMYGFILSSQYQRILDEVIKQTGISLHTQYSDVIFTFDKTRVEASGVPLQDIDALVRTCDRGFISFCVAKIELFKKPAAMQEFPKGEEVEDFDQREKLLGFSRGLLLMYAI
jgi:hypothetical protein